VQSSRLASAQALAAQKQGELDAFVAAVKARGEERERETAAKEAKDRETFKLVKAKYAADIARRDADLKRLRERPPERPDRSEVPVTRIGPERPDGAPAQFVPLEEYRALEERSYDDALRLSRLQEWVKAVGHPVE
jgi:hypothetical protein